MFCTRGQLELLFDSPVVMMNDTFSATLPFFDQIYSIHVMKFDASKKSNLFHTPNFYFIVDFPCVFTILPDRKRHTYSEMFQELKGLATQLNRSFQPDRLLTDYEPSIIAAISIQVIFN